MFASALKVMWQLHCSICQYATLRLGLINSSGELAEWLRSGLQIRVHRFESGTRLQTFLGSEAARQTRDHKQSMTWSTASQVESANSIEAAELAMQIPPAHFGRTGRVPCAVVQRIRSKMHHAATAWPQHDSFSRCCNRHPRGLLYGFKV